MLIQLSSDQIGKFYGDLEEAIRQSTIGQATASQEYLNGMMTFLLGGELQAWVLYRWEPDDQVAGKPPSVLALVVTGPILLGPGFPVLMIYALCGYDKVDVGDWKRGLETLRQYAKARNLVSVAGFTTVDRVCEIVDSIGGNSSARLVLMEV